jgi:hypothetical protein
LKMHLSLSAPAVLAAILALTGLVSAPDTERRLLQFFDNSVIRNLDESEMGPEKALALIDALCNQTVDGNGQVSGAVNLDTWDFLTWAQYRNGPGQDQDLNHWYAAHGDWATFQGACFYQQYETWNQNSITSESTHYKNKKQTGQARSGYIDVDIPGFSAETNLPSRVVPMSNRYQAVHIFKNLYGLPEEIKNMWVGLSNDFIQPRKIRKNVSRYVPACCQVWWTATTVERYVRVQWVFSVDGFYYNFNGNSGAVESWLGRGSEWKFVTSSGAWIDGHGVTKQDPGEDGYYVVNDPQVADLPPNNCNPGPRIGRRSNAAVVEL